MLLVLALFSCSHFLLVLSFVLLARDAFVRTNRRAIAMMFVRPSVHPSVYGTGVHCDHTVHFSADVSLLVG